VYPWRQTIHKRLLAGAQLMRTNWERQVRLGQLEGHHQHSGYSLCAVELLRNNAPPQIEMRKTPCPVPQEEARAAADIGKQVYGRDIGPEIDAPGIPPRCGWRPSQAL
jgi:hypothetical protein